MLRDALKPVKDTEIEAEKASWEANGGQVTRLPECHRKPLSRSYNWSNLAGLPDDPKPAGISDSGNG